MLDRSLEKKQTSIKVNKNTHLDLGDPPNPSTIPTRVTIRSTARLKAKRLSLVPLETSL